MSSEGTVPVEVRQVSSPAEVEAVRQLFREYAASLSVSLAFQGFEAEVAGLPGAYTPPGGELLLARAAGVPAGCAALRPLGEGTVELKRLYVRPEYRGLGIGRQLVGMAIVRAEELGYRRLRLDTLPEMAAAQQLYERFGFYEIAAYTFNPVPGTRFMELKL